MISKIKVDVHLGFEEKRDYIDYGKIMYYRAWLANHLKLAGAN